MTVPAEAVEAVDALIHAYARRAISTDEWRIQCKANLLTAIGKLAIDAERYRSELHNIVKANRLKNFDDDTSFADWAQSRARHALSKGAGEI